MRSLLVIGCPAVLLPLQKMVFIGNVQRREHRQPHRINRVRGFGHCSHLRVHVLRQLQNVFRIRSSQVVGLVKDLHPHAATLHVLQCRFLGSRSHNRLAPEPSTTHCRAKSRNLLSASISSTLATHPAH